MTFHFIRNHEFDFRVAEMCTSLEVSRSGYYAWKNERLSARSVADQAVKSAIQDVFTRSRGRYGYRPIFNHLKEDGIDCGRDRTLRLMRELGLKSSQASRFKPQATDSKHLFGYSPNLLKDREEPTNQDEVWVADTTYLRTEKGWRYLATVMDLGTRRIIGWSISSQNNCDLTCAALESAVGTRGKLRSEIIHHSDRGSTYASDRYQKLLTSLEMHPSMSAKGNCYDNAAMESFFGRFKTSTVQDRIFVDDPELRSIIFEYIEIFYNRFRKHSSLGYKSPVDFEENCAAPHGGQLSGSKPLPTTKTQIQIINGH